MTIRDWFVYVIAPAYGCVFLFFVALGVLRPKVRRGPP